MQHVQIQNEREHFFNVSHPDVFIYTYIVQRIKQNSFITKMLF